MPVSQGEIAFVAFSEGNNGNGGFAFVTLAPIVAGATITFTDQNWSGTAFSGTEGSLLWTAPVGGVPAGTLIQIVTNLSGGGTVPTANIGTPVQTGAAIVLTFDDGIYAMSGTVAAPGTFITAVTASSASIAGTGLTYGTDALNLGTFANAGGFNALDVGCINAATVGTTYATPALAAAAYNTATNWVFDANNSAGGAPNWPALSDAASPLNGQSTLPVCFLAGTMISTPTGETAVDQLHIGDLVTTADGRALPVKFIGRQTMSMLFADHDKTQPVLIKAGALAHNAPIRDLYVSPGHAMLVDGVLLIAAALVNGTSIVRWQETPAVFTYFHVELDEHAVIFAESAATETYCDNVPREVFDNAADYKALYPNAQPIVQLDLPTVKSARQMPSAMRQVLDARAVTIGAQRDFAVAA